MRPDLDILEKIDAYLSGTMDGEMKAEFEKQIQSNSQLAGWVDTQKALRKAMDNVHLKQVAQKTYKNYKTWKGIKVAGISIGTVILGIAMFYTVQRFWSPFKKQLNEETLNISIPDCNDPSESCFTPGNMIPSQQFEISGETDTVIVGSQGLVLAIPGNSFTDETGKEIKGKITIELKEALDPATIMLSGLSTFSGDSLLQTAGMFYVQAYQDGKQLKLKEEGILAQIPTVEDKPGMLLFDGKENPDGSINWINPKPVETFLKTVDMNTLDFYPPGYVDKLEELKLDYSRKIFRDSLYLSFEQSANIVATLDVTTSIKDSAIFDNNDAYITNPINGKRLFNENCSRCHYVNNKKFVGPGLSNVRDRWDNEQNLIAFIKNNAKLRASGHKYANKLFDNFGGSLMPNFPITDNEAADILSYIDTYSSYIDTSNIVIDSANVFTGISPSKVMAFWNKNYQNTYLATREFEQRMPYIHQTCNNAVLDVYVKNIDKKLYQVDSIAYSLSGNPKFLEFAALRQGNVEHYNVKYNLLQAFYERQSTLFQESALRTNQLFFSKHKELDRQAMMKQWQQQTNEMSREASMFYEEFTTNLNEAYRQLGYDKRPNIRVGGGSGVIASVTSLGWKNVDQYVSESVMNRTTLDYTDPDGNKAVIRYEEMKVSVADYTQFDQLFVFLVPDQLSSYMRIKGESGTYKESLNELLTYDLAVIGYKDKQVSLYISEGVKPADQGTITLKQMPLKDATDLLGKLNNFRAVMQIRDVMDYVEFEYEDQQRREFVKMIKQMREELMPVVYPCSDDMLLTDTTMVLPMN